MTYNSEFKLRNYIFCMNGEYNEIDLNKMRKDEILSENDYEYLVTGMMNGENQYKFFEKFIEEEHIHWCITWGCGGDAFYSGEAAWGKYPFKDYSNPNKYIDVPEDNDINLASYDVVFLNRIYH